MIALRRTLIALACLAAAAGCTPLYVPPVPPVPSAPEIDAPVRIGSESYLEVDGDQLVAVLDVAAVSTSGWLSLQWFDPGLAEAATDSVWIDAADAQPVSLRVGLPDHVSLRPGRWRLVVAFRGVVVRQLDVVVPAS